MDGWIDGWIDGSGSTDRQHPATPGDVLTRCAKPHSLVTLPRAGGSASKRRGGPEYELNSYQDLVSHKPTAYSAASTLSASTTSLVGLSTESSIGSL